MLVLFHGPERWPTIKWWFSPTSCEALNIVKFNLKVSHALKVSSQNTMDIHLMFLYCWANIAEGGPELNQRKRSAH